MTDDETRLCQTLIDAARLLDARGLNRGSTGNLSHRCTDARDAMWITPTGLGAAALEPASFVRCGFDGARSGALAPSSEWAFHQAIYERRPEFGAIVHLHSPHATALACLRRDLPPFHYMVAVAGGRNVRCAPYRLFGTEALSRVVVDAIDGRKACLLANHGLVAAGATLAEALKVAFEIEALCESYLLAAAVAEPARLSDGEMDEAIERFRSYGQPRPA